MLWKGYRHNGDSFIFGLYFYKRRALKEQSTEPSGLIKYEKELDMPIWVPIVMLDVCFMSAVLTQKYQPHFKKISFEPSGLLIMGSHPMKEEQICMEPFYL